MFVLVNGMCGQTDLLDEIGTAFHGKNLIDHFVGWVVPKLQEISANKLMKPQTTSECLALSQL